MTEEKIVRIGGAAAAWGDTILGARQARGEGQCRLSGRRLPRRGHHGAARPCQGQGARWRLHSRLARVCETAPAGDQAPGHQAHNQQRRHEPACVPRCFSGGSRRSGARIRRCGRHRGRPDALHAGHPDRAAGGDVFRRAAAEGIRLDERLSRRWRDRGGAGTRCGCGDHRPRGGFGDGARSADARIRLEGRRLRSALSRQPCRACHRVRRAGDGRAVHRLAGRCRWLERHGLSHRRVCEGWQLRRHQGGRHRRQGDDRHRGGADRLRDRRPAILSSARRGLRLLRGDARTGGRGSRARVERERQGARAGLQGLRHLCRWLPYRHDLHGCRLAGRQERPPDGRGAGGAHRTADGSQGSLPTGRSPSK